MSYPGANFQAPGMTKKEVDSREKEFREVEGKWIPDDVAHCRSMEGVLI